GRLQHVGVVAVDGNPGHPYYGFPADFDGHMDNARTPTNCIAVTAACMMTRRDSFESVGGLSLEFPLNYNDVDYCLKLYQSGRRVGGGGREAGREAPGAGGGGILRRAPYYTRGSGGRPVFVSPLAVSAAAG